MPVRGYYARARVFGYIMITAGALYLLYYIYKEYFS